MNKLSTAKKFVARHRVAIAVTGTAIICLSLHRHSMQSFDAFLDEKGLTEEFYTGE